jgi:hypothetical protein
MNIKYIYRKVLNITLKNNFFKKYKVYILKGFKFYIEKIKYFFSIYIINFKKC